MSGHSSASFRAGRGELLSEFIATNRLAVINQPSDLYTFDGPNDCSDIDVTLANLLAVRKFGFRWCIRSAEGVSDESLIQVELTLSGSRVEVRGNQDEIRWYPDNVNWELYRCEVAYEVISIPLAVFQRLDIDRMIAKLNGWVGDVNDRLFRRIHKVIPKRVKWWTSVLSAKCLQVRRLRKQFQTCRRLYIKYWFH